MVLSVTKKAKASLIVHTIDARCKFAFVNKWQLILWVCVNKMAGKQQSFHKPSALIVYSLPQATVHLIERFAIII